MSAKRFVFFAIVGALIFAACAPAPTPVPSTVTPVPPTSTPEPEIWEYIAFGGDFTNSGGWPELYARHIEEDLGVKVVFTDYSSHNKPSLLQMLEQLQSDMELRAKAEAAEVITISLPSEAYFNLAEGLYMSGMCKGEDGQDCLREAQETSRTEFKAYLEELIKLTHSSNPLIRTFVLGTLPTLVGYGLWGIDLTEDERQVFIEHNLLHGQMIREVAAEYGIAVIDFSPIFQPDGPTSPPREEYVQRLGITDAGLQVIADLLQQAGYKRTPLSIPSSTALPFALPSPSIALEDIAGIYTTTVTLDDLTKAGAVSGNALFLVGTYKLELTADGIVRLWKQDSIGYSLWLEGPYTLSVDALTFGTDSGALACSQAGVTHGSYAWSLADGQLTLSAPDDDCDRKFLMTALPWTRAP